jgi:hypothetical protein
MRPLALDFQRRSSPVSTWGWLVLLAGLAAALAVTWQFVNVRESLSAAELQADSLRRKTLGAAARPRESAGEQAATQQLLQTASRLAQQLNLPWNVLLHDLETATDTSVALLGFEPDAARRRLRLVGEAKTLADALAFVARLDESVLIGDAHLVSYETRQSDGQRVIGFIVDARWEDPA